MKKGFNNLIFFGVLVCCSLSCKDFIEPSLEKRNIKLLSPADSTESSQYATSFWWKEDDDALHYRIQIVSPDFLKTTSLIVDTLVSGTNNFKFTLDPGNYQWRVRAENGSSNSAYSHASFIIHPSSLKEQQLIQNFPGNNYVTKESTLLMRWEGVFGASIYRIQLDTLNFADTTKLVYNEAINSTSFSINLQKDHSYQWRVRAENLNQQSKWSTSRTIVYDQTPPAIVTLSSPVNNAQVSVPLTLSWVGVQTAKKYKLYLFKSDQVTAYGSGFPLILSSLNYSLTTGTNAELIYWKVSAIDEAGNEGEASAIRSFTIQ